MEVDATIQEDLSENDGDCGTVMRLAVSDDEDDGGANGGGCRMDNNAMMARNRANGGASDISGNASGKRKLHNFAELLTHEEGDKLYGFDEKTGKPTYGPVDSTTTGIPETDTAADVKLEEVPIKKSRPSIENPDNTLHVSSSTSPSTSTATSTTTAAVPIPPVADPVPVVASNAPIKPKLSKEELYRKPFAFGWKREVVYRANPDISKDKADVYFIAPSGKKMRSKTEITPLLDGDLTIDHFCFAKEPLGLGSEFEIVRSAKPTHRSNADVMNNSSSSTSSGKRISKPKAPKGASPPPQGWTPTRALKNSSSLNANSNSNTIGSTSSASPKTTPKISKSRKVGDPQPCTMQCAAAMGMIPQLQCIKCLCLYHHECVGLDRKDSQYRTSSVSDGGGGAGHHNYRKDYVCQSCVPQSDAVALKENQLAPTEKTAVSSQKLHGPLTLPPPGTSLIPLPTAAPPISSTYAPSPTVATNVAAATPIAAVAPAAVARTQAKSIVRPEPAVGDLPQSIAVIKGKKYVVVKKPLIPRVSNATSAPAVAAAAENNSSEASTENETGSNDRSKRQYSSNSHRKNTSAAAAAASSTTSAAAQSSSTGIIAQNSSPGNSSNSGQLQYSTRLADSPSATATSLSFASNFFANVSVGYGAILHILKYLKIHERPRAASVCKIWNLVAKDRSLWQTVRMKNSKVSNWAGFTAALRRGETRHLDLRKLLVSSTKVEETWSEFGKYIGTVASLEHIDMCRCSAQVVENLFLTNPNLTILSALAINDDSLNLINIDNLVMLQELRLRTLDKCTLEGDLTPLRALKNLKHLTLSSVRQLGTKAIEVIGELNSLVSLELGECNDFDSRFTDSVLPKLSNLERLRLEIGQDQCRTLDILDSVAKLENLSQLEFVNFDIKPGFDDKLAQCTNIRKLLIIPTYISQSATTNNIVLNAVLKLQETLNVFTWGVTVELLRVTALYVDQCEDSTRKERRHFDECIPVLKPVPGSIVAEPKDEEVIPPANAVPQIEILPLDKVEEILRDNLATTKFTIVKVPYHATWKQQLVE